MICDVTITPFARPVAAQAHIPGSKSITNRALLLAAMRGGNATIKNALRSRDTEIMVKIGRAHV